MQHCFQHSDLHIVCHQPGPDGQQDCNSLFYGNKHRNCYCHGHRLLYHACDGHGGSRQAGCDWYGSKHWWYAKNHPKCCPGWRCGDGGRCTVDVDVGEGPVQMGRTVVSAICLHLIACNVYLAGSTVEFR